MPPLPPTRLLLTVGLLSFGQWLALLLPLLFVTGRFMLPTLPVVLLELTDVLRPATFADSRGVVTVVPRVDDVLPDDVATSLRGVLTVALPRLALLPLVLFVTCVRVPLTERPFLSRVCAETVEVAINIPITNREFTTMFLITVFIIPNFKLLIKMSFRHLSFVKFDTKINKRFNIQRLF